MPTASTAPSGADLDEPGDAPTIGVLAVQGDVREHAAALTVVGARVRPVRRPTELEGLDGLVIPGGESTVIDKLLRAFELAGPVRAAIAGGLPVYGSCAGMILLADEVLDGTSDQQTLGGMAITVRRNAFGRQVDSFETDLSMIGLSEPQRPIRAVFIRAPWVEHVGDEVEVLARVPAGPAAGKVVAARQGDLLVTSFHPEVSGDARVHDYFARMVRERRARRPVRTPDGR